MEYEFEIFYHFNGRLFRNSGFGNGHRRVSFHSVVSFSAIASTTSSLC